MSLQNTLKEIAVSAIPTARDIYGTISVIVDYRFGVFPFSVNKLDVTEVFNLRNPLNDRSAEHDMILESYAKTDAN